MGLDLDAIVDDGDPYEFTFGGEVYSLPADPDLKFLEYLAEGAFQAALWVVLGEAQYQRLDASSASLTTKRAKALFDDYTKSLGIDPGKSGGPPKSSKRTGRR